MARSSVPIIQYVAKSYYMQYQIDQMAERAELQSVRSIDLMNIIF